MDTQSDDNKTVCSSEQPAPVKTIKARVIVNWPVPHIIVSFNGASSAWGRLDLQLRGYKKTRKDFCKSFLYNPAIHGKSSRKFVNEIAPKVRIYAKFYNKYGYGLDEDWILLQPVGWFHMVANVVEMTFEFDDKS
ncbi:hypothetical protein BDW22DRAFT_1363091 [Trametopsis cervina]|nr:hypothetical protein BDW22DRAFT_1363091 [Trametopsis cervina]